MRRIILAAGVAGLAVAGCGGGDDEGLSKSEFLTKGNAICATANTQANQIGQAAFQDPENPTGEEAQGAFEKIVPLQKDSLSKLRALDPPKDDDDQVDAIFSAADEGNQAYEQASQDPDAALELLNKLGTPEDPFANANKLAQDYGLTECAK